MKTAKEYLEEEGFECYDACSHADGCIVVNVDDDDKKELRKEFKYPNLHLRCPITLF